MRTNPPAYERFIIALCDAMKASDDLIADHGLDCDCGPCHDVYGMRYTLSLFEGIAVSDAIWTPAIRKAERQIKGEYPDARFASADDDDEEGESPAPPAPQVQADEPTRIQFREFV